MSALNAARFLVCSVALLATTVAAGQDCVPAVDVDAFGAPGPFGGVVDLAVWDDGSGPSIVAVGEFLSAGSDTTFQVARWDGGGWAPIGDDFVLTAIPTPIDFVFNAARSVAVYDDGSGPAVYVGGNFEWEFEDGTTIETLAKWDGQRWTQIPAAQVVNHLSVVDLGDGPVLLVGGANMLPIQPGFARSVGAWDGSQWIRFPAMPLGFTHVNDTALFNTNGSSDLHVLTGATSTPNAVLRLRSDQTWELVPESGSVLFGVAYPTTMTVHDDGTGEALYFGGFGFRFDGPPPNATFGLARWDGIAWSAVEGFDPALGLVRNLHSTRRDGMSELVVTGNFTSLAGVPVDGLAILRNGEWITPGAGVLETFPGSPVDLLPACVLSIDGTDELVVGGFLSAAGGVHASNIARWDGSTWRPLSDQPADDLNGTVHTIDEAVLDGDPTLIVGGRFTSPDAPDSRSIAAYDGSGWSSLGDGFSEQVFATASVDHGDGLELYAAGSFRFTGEQPMSRVARWDRSVESWVSVGGGVNNAVGAATAFQGRLIVGGSFTQAGGAPASRIAQWDGFQWDALIGANGSGLSGPVRALQRFDNGAGDALFAGGDFQQADGQIAIGIARWDGSSWSALIGPGGAGLNGGVRVMRVFDAGDGPELIVAGSFSEADGIAADGLARWDGQRWLPIDFGDELDVVTAIEVFDDGSGPALYIGGYRNEPAPPTQIGGVLRWDGAGCEPIDLEIFGTINTLGASPAGSSPFLLIGGDFDYITTAGELRLARNILRWSGCAQPDNCSADVTGDGVVDLADLNLVLGNFGQTTSEGDTNKDGIVDLADLSAVLATFGTTCP